MSKKSRRHSRYVSSSTGNDPNFDATASRSAERLRCCQSGVRMPGRRRGSNSERAAFSRNLAAKSAVAPSCRTTSACTSSGSGRSRSTSGGSSTSGKRTTNPSSPHSVSTSMPAYLADLRGDRHGPGGVDPPAARREHADAPIAEIVADALDEDGRRVGNGARRGHLVAQILQEVFRRQRVEIVIARQAFDAPRPAAGAAGPASAFQSPGRTRAGGPRGRPSRTASSRVRPAPATPGPGRA